MLFIMMTWIGFVWLKIGKVMFSVDLGNEPLRYMNVGRGKFLG
jgi:hypothetical protein